jgi:23S rRNA G2445 N2-methylase RlmL
MSESESASDLFARAVAAAVEDALREHLTIDVSVKTSNEHQTDYIDVRVAVHFDDEEIASDDDSAVIP